MRWGWYATRYSELFRAVNWRENYLRSSTELAAIAIAYLLFFSLPAFGADAWSLQSGEFDASSKKERTEIARDLAKKIKTLLQYVPSPSPSESDWLKQEREAIHKIESSDASIARSI